MLSADKEVKEGALPFPYAAIAHDFLPDLESLPYLLAVLGGRPYVASRAEGLGNGTIGCQDVLSVPRGLKPPYTSLPLALRLVRILRSG
jgi:hypothetical protein